MLILHLTGSFRVIAANGTSPGGLSRRAQAMLAYLACQPGMRAERGLLADLLWSDRAEEQARASLRQELAVLRRALPDGVMHADRQSVWLSPALVTAAGTDSGPDFLKGFDLGSEGFEDWLREMRAKQTKAAVPTPPRGQISDRPSLAVMAFDNMSGDLGQEYFSDGITDDIITALSRSPWLFIIARNTTFTYKGKNLSAKQIAEDLGVRYVLEGSVRRSGDRIRVTAQLIDGHTNGHVWSDRYDGQLADMFDLQDEITRNVVASVQTRVHLTAGEMAEPRPRPDLTVWDLTMQAWHFLYDFDGESYNKAHALLEQALARDPNSAEANLVLSVILYHSAILGFSDTPGATAQKAYECARRATSSDGRNEYAHWALGLSCFGLGRHDEAILALQRAVELNPNCSVAYGSLGTALGLVGRVEEAIANQELAIRSNPRDPSIFFRFSGMGLAHFLAGRYDTAIEWASKSVHMMPQWYFGQFVLIASLMRAGRQAEARASADSLRNTLPDISVTDLARMPLKDPEVTAALQQCLHEAGVPD